MDGSHRPDYIAARTGAKGRGHGIECSVLAGASTSQRLSPAALCCASKNCAPGREAAVLALLSRERNHLTTCHVYRVWDGPVDAGRLLISGLAAFPQSCAPANPTSNV